MADVLIRNLDPEVVERVEARAAALGLSRQEFLHRELSRLGRPAMRPTRLEDLASFGARFADLEDEDTMEQAWS